VVHRGRGGLHRLGAAPDEASLGIEAPSDTELLLHLAPPCAYLPRLMAYYPLAPVKRSCVERWGRAWIAPEHIVTNGPFRLVERRVRDRLRLARFDGYWGRDEVQLATVDAYAASGITTQLNMYLTGQVGLDDQAAHRPVRRHPARPDAHAGPQSGVTFFRFNVTRKPFDDPRVREALALALDREALARDVMRGGELGAVSFVPRACRLHGRHAAAARRRSRARPARAAGFPGGRGFPSFELLYPNNEITRDFCEASAAQWRDVLGCSRASRTRRGRSTSTAPGSSATTCRGARGPRTTSTWDLPRDLPRGQRQQPHRLARRAYDALITQAGAAPTSPRAPRSSGAPSSACWTPSPSCRCSSAST
jgi:oligopeptide transport system substrate-binding protein